jgi:hypothetical protein
MPITEAAQCKIWTTIYYSKTGVIGVSFTWDTNVFWSVLSCIISQSLIKGILPDVHKEDPKTWKTGDHEPHTSVAKSTERDTILSGFVNNMATVYYTQNCAKIT